MSRSTGPCPVSASAPRAWTSEFLTTSRRPRPAADAVVHAQHLAGRPVHRDDPFVRVHRDDPLGHAREHGLLLHELLVHGPHLSAQLRGHPVERLGERPQFLRLRHGHAVRQLPAREPGRAPRHLLDGTTQPAGHDEAHGRRERADENRRGREPPAHARELRRERREGQRRPDGARGPPVFDQGNRDVEHVRSERRARPLGDSDAPGERRDDLGPVAVVLHRGGVGLGVGNDAPGRKDDGDARLRGGAQVLHEGVDAARAVARRLGAHALLDEPGARLEDADHLLAVEVPERKERVRAGRGHRDDGDEEVRREELPEKPRPSQESCSVKRYPTPRTVSM